MRVIAGKYRHRLLTYPDDKSHIRPTKDRIREAIFGALGNIENKVVLDLYAGSGSMGIEALSRGSKISYFVDINDIAINTVKNNLTSLNISNSDYKVIKKLDIDSLLDFKKDNIQFDIVILDPPYKEGKYQEILDKLIEYNLLNEHAIIVFESDYELNICIDNPLKIKDYKYGEIKVKIIWR